MSITRLSVKDFLDKASHLPVFDVRSPGEYAHAHMPKAFNLFIFNDDERKKIGIAYKQQGKQPAIKIGLDFWGPRMSRMIGKVEKVLRMAYPNTQKVLVHCWRGGMRSGAVAWLLDFYGYEVYLLDGGYKAYRHHVLQSFQVTYPFVLLGGYTGSGKTELLREMHLLQHPVLDLEGLASHKGSAFGAIGMEPQPSQEMFENLLSHQLSQLISKESKLIWVEDESQRIGAINIPHPIWEQMRKAPLYFAEIPFAARLDYILKDYGIQDVDMLLAATERIQKRLGPLETTTVLSLLRDKKITEAFGILLHYYDKQYKKSLLQRENLSELLHNIDMPGTRRDENVKRILEAMSNPLV